MTVLQFFDTLASHPKRPNQINGGPPCWLLWLGPLSPSALPPFTLNISIFAVLFYCLKVCSSAETSASRACNLDRTYPFLLSYFIFFSFFFLLFSRVHATLHPALSVGLSVCLSVTFYFFYSFYSY